MPAITSLLPLLPTFVAPYTLGIAVTWLLARDLKRRAGDAPAPLLHPGWPTFWTVTSTLLALKLTATNCSAMTSTLHMSWLFLFPPVATHLFMEAVHVLAETAKARGLVITLDWPKFVPQALTGR